MTYQFSLYSAIFLFTALIAAVTTYAAWQRRQAPGGRALFLMTAVVLIWVVGGLLDASAVELSTHIFWSKVEFLGTFTVSPFFLMFVLAFTHRSQWLTPRNLAFLFLIPVLTIGFTLTNEWHHLIWTGFTPVAAVPNTYTFHHGPWFWVGTIYVNSLVGLGVGLLLNFFLRTQELYRAQAVALAVSPIFPWVGFVLVITNLNPLPGLDLVPIGFAATELVLVFTFARLHLMDVVPIAREFLVEHMTDGLLVLDHHNRVVDINAAARLLLGLAASQRWIGQPAEACLAHHPELVACLDQLRSTEWALAGPTPRYFDLQLSPLTDRNHRLTGKVAVFRDITHRKEAERALAERLEQIEKLKNELGEQAIHDHLTGLYNRRHLEELFGREIAAVDRRGGCLSVAVLDLDNFKAHNDTYGHPHGDRLLRAVGQVLLTQFRRTDLAFRYGGDEFFLILPGSSSEDTRARVEALRPLFQALDLGESTPAAIGFSAGVATYPAHARWAADLLRVADQALYTAKQQGRKHTCIP